MTKKELLGRARNYTRRMAPAQDQDCIIVNQAAYDFAVTLIGACPANSELLAALEQLDKVIESAHAAIAKCDEEKTKV